MKNPSDVCFTLLFNACAQLQTEDAMNQIKSVLLKMSTHFYSNRRLLTSLLDASLKCGDVKRAEELFEKSVIKDLSMYGLMMKGMMITTVHQIFYIGDLLRLCEKRYAKKNNRTV